MFVCKISINNIDVVVRSGYKKLSFCLFLTVVCRKRFVDMTTGH